MEATFKMILQTEPVNEVDYFQQHDKISSTILKDFDESPEACHGYYFADEKRERPRPTKGMDVGSVVHAVFLEQRALEEVVSTYPDFCLNKNGGLIGVQSDLFRRYVAGEVTLVEIPKEHLTASGKTSTKAKTKNWIKSLKEDQVPLPPEQFGQLTNQKWDVEYYLKQEDIDRCGAIIEKLRNSEACEWIDNKAMIREQPIYWKEHDQPFEFRCKPDFALAVTRAFLFDLKVTAYWSEFWRYTKSQNNLLSHAHYTSGMYHKYHPNPSRYERLPEVIGEILNFVQFRYVAINPEWPHEIAIWKYEQDDILEAFEKRHKILFDLNEATKSGDWRHRRTKARENSINLT